MKKISIRVKRISIRLIESWYWMSVLSTRERIRAFLKAVSPLKNTIHWMQWMEKWDNNERL